MTTEEFAKAVIDGVEVTPEDMQEHAQAIKALADTANKAMDAIKKIAPAMIEAGQLEGMSLRSGGKIRSLSHSPTVCEEAKAALGDKWAPVDFLEKCAVFSEKSVKEYMLEKGIDRKMEEIFTKTYSEKDKAQSLIFKRRKK